MLLLSSTVGLAGLILWAGKMVDSLMTPNATVTLAQPEGIAVQPLSGLRAPWFLRNQHRSVLDSMAILHYHNQIRASVNPPAANMEYMVWDESLAKRAEAWASLCIWDHGPIQQMQFMGQNLGVFYGRYTSVMDLVKMWAKEKEHYIFPALSTCNPDCPWHCRGPVCTHYTQMVWASSNRLGCAIHICDSINVWGSTWYQATYLVCNYASKGNWLGQAPYQTGTPCSACPRSYEGGSCINNMCLKLK